MTLKYEFLKDSLNDYVRVYKEFLIPALICDDKLTVYWSNRTAQSLYPHLTGTDGIRALLGEFDIGGLLEKMKREGTIWVDGVLSFSDMRLNLMPILHDGDVAGVVALIAGASQGIGPADAAVSSKTPQMLEKSIRESVEEIFGAMDSVTMKADMLNSGLIKAPFNSMSQGAYRILRIASNISYYSQFQVEPPVRPDKPTDVFDLILSSEPAVRAISGELGIPVRYSLPLMPSFADIDAKLLQAAFFNVLHNSFYFTKESNRVEITGANTDTEIILSVADEGAGISSEHISEIFKPYFSRGHDGKPAGIGLGLTVSQTIIKSSGGRIEVVSEPGKGTKVSMILPRAPLSRNVSFAQGAKADNTNRFSSVYIGLRDAALSPYRRQDEE